MAVRVGINGFGRIGRLVFRVLAQYPNEFEVVAINDLSDAKSLALLLKYDSVHRQFNGTVEADGDALIVNGKKIQITKEKDPANLPWKALGCQIAIESTGFFTNKASLQKHIDAGAERVILTAPPKDDLDATIVLGVNDDKLTSDMRIVSNASCTTNCLAPVVKAAAEGPMKGILQYTTDPLVSSDIIGNPHSSIFMGDWTQVIGGNMVKILSWYDNEWGYSNRVVELARKMAAL